MRKMESSLAIIPLWYRWVSNKNVYYHTIYDRSIYTVYGLLFIWSILVSIYPVKGSPVSPWTIWKKYMCHMAQVGDVGTLDFLPPPPPYKKCSIFVFSNKRGYRNDIFRVVFLKKFQALWDAAEIGDIEACRDAIQRGADIEWRDDRVSGFIFFNIRQNRESALSWKLFWTVSFVNKITCNFLLALRSLNWTRILSWATGFLFTPNNNRPQHYKSRADSCLIFRRKDGRAAGETVPFSEILDNYRLLTDLKHVQSTLIDVFFSFWWLTLMTPGDSIQSSNII